MLFLLYVARMREERREAVVGEHASTTRPDRKEAAVRLLVTFCTPPRVRSMRRYLAALVREAPEMLTGLQT